MGGTMDSRPRVSNRPYLGPACAVLGIVGASFALQVGAHWNHSLNPGGVFAWAAFVLALVFGGRLASTMARWHGVVLLAAGYIMLLLGVWILITPSLADHPNRTAVFALVSAALLLAVGVTTVLWGRDSREIQNTVAAAAEASVAAYGPAAAAPVSAPEGAAGGAPVPAADAVVAAKTEPITAVLGVVGGLLGILGAVAAMTSHGPAMGGPAFVLALAGIFGGLLAEGNRTARLRAAHRSRCARAGLRLVVLGAGRCGAGGGGALRGTGHARATGTPKRGGFAVRTRAPRTLAWYLVLVYSLVGSVASLLGFLAFTYFESTDMPEAAHGRMVLGLPLASAVLSVALGVAALPIPNEPQRCGPPCEPVGMRPRRPYCCSSPACSSS